MTICVRIADRVLRQQNAYAAGCEQNTEYQKGTDLSWGCQLLLFNDIRRICFRKYNNEWEKGKPAVIHCILIGSSLR